MKSEKGTHFHKYQHLPHTVLVPYIGTANFLAAENCVKKLCVSRMPHPLRR